MTDDSSPAPKTVAAVDLGSNSFHMVIARYLEHDLHMLDRLREPVRLADGLQDDGVLSEEAADRAIACLERFGQRVAGIPRAQIRAVGTNTLRRAQRSREFMQRALRALGHPVEVISGQEEARLIYLGISHTHPLEGARRLAVDIGGGSTEIIVGHGFEVLRAHSLFMGCVNYSRKYFPGGGITREAFRAAETAAELELSAVQEPLRAMGWDSSVGSSGTINAISDLLRLGQGNPEITLSRLKKLRKTLITASTTSDLSLEGLKADRAPVLPGGLAILIAVAKSLSVETVVPSAGALREGVLYDLVGRIERQDVRDRTIRRLVDQYHVDLAQAGRVENSALGLLVQLEERWWPDGEEAGLAKKLLTWASLLHEIGLTVSYTGYHKHGAYLVTHMHLPGFAAEDQRVLASLIRGHRRKLVPAVFESVPSDRVEFAQRIGALLRLAVLLNRSRSLESARVPEISWKNGDLHLTFPEQWLEQHPLTRADLEQEAGYLRAIDVRLKIRES